METAANIKTGADCAVLKTGVSGDTLCVHVPGIVSDDQCERITEELYRIGQEQEGITTWNVDLSSVPEVPFCLAGALGCLHSKLSGLGCEVRYMRSKAAV